MIDFTPIARRLLCPKAARTSLYPGRVEALQRAELTALMRRLAMTAYGRRHGVAEAPAPASVYERLLALPVVDYEELRPEVMRMIGGEKDVLWPGRCRCFAQSSGTSGGKSKYIPVTAVSLQRNHYRGAGDSVGHYLLSNPGSRMFSGKGLILGGSFANEVPSAAMAPGVKIGDLSATLIDRIPFGAGLFRIPDKRIALMPDWTEKLPQLARAAMDEDVTNLSGVPSWFLGVIREVLELKGCERATDVWPNLEVFFHGGIAFGPYRDEYRSLCDPAKMHYMETYNASEGFFAYATTPGAGRMQLLLDGGVFYEFAPPGGGDPVPAWQVREGKVYEMLITAANGLWRYRLGDTVRIEDADRMLITIAGRTKSFINAFGEEVMEYNADAAISAAAAATGARIRNYTVAPVYAAAGRRGRHQWVIEWITLPADAARFAEVLDATLQSVNSDYQAKRSHSLFLDPPLVTTVPEGTFDRWLATHGNGRLGGQRKIPRLSNDRKILTDLGL